MRPGDRIEVGTPTGTFSADEAMGGRHLCIAAGSGITPMISVAGTVLRHPDARVTLLYGNRTTGSVMFAEDLGDLKNRYGPRLQLVHVLSREPRDVELFSGRLDADRIRRLVDLLAPAETLDHVWLCGPFAMINDARAVLDELGVPADRIHFELFYVDEPPPELHREDPAIEGETSDVTVVLDGLSATAPMPRTQSILDAAQAARSDLPVRLQGRCLRHLPGQGHRRRGRHAPQLRPRGRRGRRRLRPHLPVVRRLRHRHRRLRRLSASRRFVDREQARVGASSTVNRRESALRRPGAARVGVVGSAARRSADSAAALDEAPTRQL